MKTSKAIWSALALLISSTLSAQSFSEKLGVSVGVSGVMGEPANNISHLSTVYQDEYPRLTYQATGELFYRYKPDKSIGIVFDSWRNKKAFASIDTESRIERYFVGPSFSSVWLRKGDFFIRPSLTLGYVQVNSQELDLNKDQKQVYTSHGFGAEARLSFGYNLDIAKGLDIELYISMIGESIGAWSGLEPKAGIYNGQGLFLGKHSNGNGYLTIGISISSPR